MCGSFTIHFRGQVVAIYNDTTPSDQSGSRIRQRLSCTQHATVIKLLKAASTDQFFQPALLQQSLQFAAFPITETETNLEPLRSTKTRPNAWVDRSTSHLTRSKSMESLPRQRTISTSTLRDLFESKVATRPKIVHKPKNPDEPQPIPVAENTGINHKSTENLLVIIEDEDINNIEKSVEAPNGNEENVTSKVT